MQNVFTGQFTASAAEASGGKTITLGCTPALVMVFNATTPMQYTLFNTGSATEDIICTGSIGVLTTGGTNIALSTTGSGGFTIAAAALAENDVVSYVAYRLS